MLCTLNREETALKLIVCCNPMQFATLHSAQVYVRCKKLHFTVCCNPMQFTTLHYSAQLQSKKSHFTEVHYIVCCNAIQFATFHYNALLHAVLKKLRSTEVKYITLYVAMQFTALHYSAQLQIFTEVHCTARSSPHRAAKQISLSP